MGCHIQVGAVNEEEEITALGYHLAALPVDVRIGKVGFYSLMFWCFCENYMFKSSIASP